MPVRHVPHTKGPYTPRSFGVVNPSVITTVYSDTVTGSVVFSGTLVESQSHASTPSGTVVLSGPLVEGLTHASTPSGTVVLSATEAELLTFDDVVTGTVVFSGSLVESYVPGTPGTTQSRGPLLGVYFPN